MESDKETTKTTKQKQQKKGQIPLEKSVRVSGSPCDSTVDETILDYEVIFDRKSE